MKKYRLRPIGLLLALIGGLVWSGWRDYSMSKDAPQGIDSRLLAATTRFGLKLFNHLVEQGRGQNVFASPMSVAMVLSMTYNGAVGGTEEGMAKTLELQGMNQPELNQAYVALRSALENPDPNVQVAIANSLWARKSLLFNPAFLKRNQDFYGAEVVNLDFNDPHAPATINRWVGRKTQGKIDKIIDRIDADALLFLINAIYFKGAWSTAFDVKQTKEEVFTLATGQTKKHPLMSRFAKYRYYRGPGFQAVSLPYGQKRVSLYIFLPDKDSSLQALYKGLTAEAWQGWMSQFRLREGRVALPRFKLEYEAELKPVLKAMGMATAFDPMRADFSGVCTGTEKVFIAAVKHKTFVEVNEEGTEAAAVTSVEMRATSMPVDEEPPFNLIVDRPFFCAIRDDKTGTLLFLGSIVEPK